MKNVFTHEMMTEDETTDVTDIHNVLYILFSLAGWPFWHGTFLELQNGVLAVRGGGGGVAGVL